MCPLTRVPQWAHHHQAEDKIDNEACPPFNVCFPPPLLVFLQRMPFYIPIFVGKTEIHFSWKNMMIKIVVVKRGTGDEGPPEQ